MLRGLRERLRAWRSRNDPYLECGQQGFALTQGRARQRVRWDSIASVFAFKRDLITVDQICLSFLTDEGEVIVHEEMEGYAQLLEAIEHHLGISPEWMLEVMFPAFETNLMQIYPPGEKETG